MRRSDCRRIGSVLRGFSHTYGIYPVYACLVVVVKEVLACRNGESPLLFVILLGNEVASCLVSEVCHLSVSVVERTGGVGQYLCAQR